MIRRTFALACASAIAFAVAGTHVAAQSPAPIASPTMSASPTASATASIVASPLPASPMPSAAASAEDAVPDQYVHGQLLTIGNGFIVLTTGDALRLRAGTPIPKGAIVGSLIRLTIDQLARDVKAVELEPHLSLPGETDASGLGHEYVVRSPGSAPKPAASATAAPAPSELVTVTIFVEVPSNTPLGDDVYISTDRSGYNPSELRMDHVDLRHFTTTVSLPSGSRLRYQYTRGTNASVERARNGDIAPPHEFVAAAKARETDEVARWADIN